MKSFSEVFGHAPEVVADAPGRVNLLGEHTDYNDGFVLPIAISQRTSVSLRRREDKGSGFSLYAVSFDRRIDFSLDTPPAEQFARYVYGCLIEAKASGARIPPLEIHVASDVPIGVGLSSSAALEVATLRALRSLLALPLDDLSIARLAQAAEIKHAGVACGIMDQMAASLADTTNALFIDTRTLACRLTPLPAGSAVLVLDSGIPRSLAASGYNTRRSECEEAARELGVRALRDISDLKATEALPEPFRRRARHVISENARVLEAVAYAPTISASRFGKLMNASHASLRDDFEVSTAKLDVLVGLLQAEPGVHGARLTGAGFGGACVALCEKAALANIATRVLAAYAGQGVSGRQLVPAKPG